LNGQTDTNLQLIFLSSISIILSLFNVLLIDGGHYNTQKPMNSVTNCLLRFAKSSTPGPGLFCHCCFRILFTP